MIHIPAKIMRPATAALKETRVWCRPGWTGDWEATQAHAVVEAAMPSIAQHLAALAADVVTQAATRHPQMAAVLTSLADEVRAAIAGEFVDDLAVLVAETPPAAVLVTAAAAALILTAAEPEQPEADPTTVVLEV